MTIPKTKTKMTYLEMARQKAKEKASQAIKGNEREFTPKDSGKYRIRLLPPLNAEDGQLPYHTHSFHFLPGVGDAKGEYVYSKKYYGDERDPIDKVVSEMYDSKEESLIKEAGKIKRKRNFYWNCIVYDADGNPSFKVLRDTTNEGKLTRILCKKMGLPFFRDVEDNWVEDQGLLAEENSDNEDGPEYVDLTDIENGHDFYIVKKVTGKNPWDFNFEDSYASKKPRPLTEEERELLRERVDLEKYVDYIEDINVVKRKLEAYLNNENKEEDINEEEESTSKIAPKGITSKKSIPKRPAIEDDDLEIEDLSREIDDED